MDWWWFFLIALIIGPIIGGAFHSNAKARTFQSLGDISGKPIADIIGIVGEPNSISAAAENNTLYQWIDVVGSSSTHYAILVDDEGNALGFTHQHQS